MKGCDEMARNRLLFNTNDDYLEIFPQRTAIALKRRR